MNNKGISDFVAASMDAVLNSDQHKSLFKSQYKFASKHEDEHDAKDKKKKVCENCKEDEDNCYCWSADDNLDNVPPLPTPPKGNVDRGASGAVVNQEGSNITFTEPGKITAPPPQKAHDGKTASLNIALDSLLTASAALDSIGLSQSSALSLKLASLVSQAKKKMSPKEKKELMERLQKGKKKKGVNKASDKDMKMPAKKVSKAYGNQSQFIKNSYDLGDFGLSFLTVGVIDVMNYVKPMLTEENYKKFQQEIQSFGTTIGVNDLTRILSRYVSDVRATLKAFLMSAASKL